MCSYSVTSIMSIVMIGGFFHRDVWWSFYRDGWPEVRLRTDKLMSLGRSAGRKMESERRLSTLRKLSGFQLGSSFPSLLVQSLFISPCGDRRWRSLDAIIVG